MPENSKKLSAKEIILYSFESIIMLFDIIMSIGIFGTGSTLAGFIFLLSAFLISPLCEKFLHKIPITSFQNSTITRIGIQFIFSLILFIIGVAVGTTSTETNKHEMIEDIISVTETKLEQTTFEKPTIENIEETESITETEITTVITEITTETTTIQTEQDTTEDSKNEVLQCALQFIEFSDYSYNGLVEILEFQGYSHEEAMYAADNCEADWNAEAIESAEGYLKVRNFSKEELINQLLSVGYTQEQAEYGANAVNYDETTESSAEVTIVPMTQPSVIDSTILESKLLDFILNAETGCIHINEECSAAQKILPENRSAISIWDNELANYYGVYWACGKCSSRYSSDLPKF
ncbi:MAG: Ltp family lipoprotein [Oscillospiraceae bacterium]|nr:Ltp family lipoprotein [Oscillospiraceae bacterium]